MVKIACVGLIVWVAGCSTENYARLSPDTDRPAGCYAVTHYARTKRERRADDIARVAAAIALEALVAAAESYDKDGHEGHGGGGHHEHRHH